MDGAATSEAGTKDDASHDRERNLARGVAAVVAVAATALTLGLVGLGSTGLVRMEGMVAAIAEEMLRSGDFAVPRLYGEIYSYKPPLLYWLVAASVELTGSTTEWTVRLPSALSSLLLGLAMLFFVGRVAGSRAGAVAGIASFSSVLFLEKFRVAEFDAVLTAFVGVAVTAACYILSDDEGSKGRPLVWGVCYLMLTAALLSKGLPALMAFVPGLILAALRNGRRRVLFGWAHLAGVALFAVLIGAYVWRAHAAAGWAPFLQPLEEASLRGGEWSLGAFGMTWLKPLLILAFFLPWSTVVLWGLSWHLSWGSAGATGGHRAERMTVAAYSFLIAGTAAFMCVPTHESRYYLPLAAPIAIIAGVTLDRGPIPHTGRRLVTVLAGILGLVTVMLGALPVLATPTTSGRLLLLVAGLAAASTSVWTARRRSRRLTAALMLSSLCFWAAETQVFGPRRAEKRDQRQVALELSESLPAVDVLWTLGPAGTAGKYSGLLHYLGRRVRTFSPVEGPPPGGICVLRTVDVEHMSPQHVARLQLIAQASGRRWDFALYRVAAGVLP